MKARGVILLVIASLFWGLAFSVQSIGGKEVGAYTFNSLRMLLSALVMLPAIRLFDKKGWSVNRPQTNDDRKRLWGFAVLSGVFLAAGTNLQQVALVLGAEAGRAGFLTALYIIMVPLVGIFLKKKFGWNLWLGVAVALVGMYFLCINGSFGISLPDLLLILCAVGFTLQICTIDKASDTEALRFTTIQFLTCGIISFVLTFFFEILPADGGFAGWATFFGSTSFWVTLLYTAIFSGCVGYTLQVIGQKDLAPPVASLIMCLESVFSVIFGFLILHESMTGRQLLGCGLIFAAILICQLRISPKDKMKI